MQHPGKEHGGHCLGVLLIRGSGPGSGGMMKEGGLGPSSVRRVGWAAVHMQLKVRQLQTKNRTQSQVGACVSVGSARYGLGRRYMSDMAVLGVMRSERP